MTMVCRRVAHTLWNDHSGRRVSKSRSRSSGLPAQESQARFVMRARSQYVCGIAVAMAASVLVSGVVVTQTPVSTDTPTVAPDACELVDPGFAPVVLSGGTPIDEGFYLKPLLSGTPITDEGFVVRIPPCPVEASPSDETRSTLDQLAHAIAPV